MSPTPLSPSTVHVLLQYISPPSQLLLPLPPYLLSKPLLQRHHFLDISPSDPHEYLCWPASLTTSLKAIHLLESLPRAVDDEPVPYPVQYTSDDERTCAHVHITSTGDDGLRLVFQWDDVDGWKFHDANLMPFPVSSTPSLLDALGSLSSGVRLEVPGIQAEHNHYGFDNDDTGSDDDDYWNAYGAQELAAASPGAFPLSAKDVDATNEDAYWARYNSVHGTADSTRPSPRPLPKKAHPGLEDHLIDPDSPHPLPVPVREGDADASQDAIPIPHSSLSQATARSPWDPASPQTLARLLADISPRHSPAIVSQTDEEEQEALSPPFDSSGSEEQLETPPLTNGLGLTEDGETIVSPATNSVVEVEGSLDGENDEGVDFDEAEWALRDSIRGLYALWKAGRRKDSRENERDAFLRIVDEAVA
ncbi:hypothetical protein EIP91_008885 [Steccherinum ochraceum]|uniref:Uncharacterized protein n=1 Tax=Steccherinum ochraceum TaxID=92696 RepID=A0A4R0S3V2_9APHY|nr:hypothetical protein EIP91_008885 [Steccherinum ochraceum]